MRKGTDTQTMYVTNFEGTVAILEYLKALAPMRAEDLPEQLCKKNEYHRRAENS